MELVFQAARFDIDDVAPLARGAWLVVPGSSTRIARAYLFGPEEMRSIVADIHRSQLMYPWRGSPIVGQTVVRNVQRREALYADVPAPWERSFHLRPLELFVPYALHIARGVLSTRTSQDTELDQAWLTHAELVHLRPAPLGSFSSLLTIDDFVVRATAQ